MRLKGSFTDLFCIVTYIPYLGCPNADAGETWAIVQKVIDSEVRESDCSWSSAETSTAEWGGTLAEAR